MPYFTICYVIAVVFLATLIRSTFGFGEAMVGVPLLALRIPVAVATPLAMLVSIVVAGMVVVQDWRKIHLRSAGGLLVASLLGVPLGLWLLAKASENWIDRVLGTVLVLFALYSLLFKRRLHLEKDHPAWLMGAGFVSGILGGAYGMNGPPLVVYGSLRQWSPQHFRATLQGYFLPASVISLGGCAAIGLWTPLVTRYFLICLPAVLVATLIGRWLNHRLHGEGFFRYVYAGLLLIGCVLIAQSLPR